MRNRTKHDVAHISVVHLAMLYAKTAANDARQLVEKSYSRKLPEPCRGCPIVFAT